METSPLNNTAEFTRLLNNFERARQTAPTRTEYEFHLNQYNSLVASFLRGEVAQDVLKENEDGDKPGRMLINNIVELRKILQIIHSERKKEVEEDLAHENAHMAKALSLGLDAKYGLQLMYAHNKLTYDYQVFVNVLPPANMSDEEYRHLLQEIINAPDDLSESDKSQLGLQIEP